MNLVLSTCPGDQADGLARQLVGDRLAACCNVVPAVTSHYWWEGALQQETEALLIFKVPEEATARLQERLASLHPYEVPEILVLEVAGGHAPYLAWVARTVGEG